MEVDQTGRLYVFLRGAIDESASLEDFFKALGRDAVINMRGIQRINSIGITRWIPLLRTYTKSHHVEFDQIAYPVVNYANCILDFLGTGVVRSVMAPYYCAKCTADRDVVVTRDECLSVQNGAPEKRCSSCEAVMAFNELDSYFSFLRVGGR
jgi:hypothetical protein